MSPTRCPHQKSTTRPGTLGRRPWSKCGPWFGCSYPSKCSSVRLDENCSATEIREIVEFFETCSWKRMFPWNIPSHRRYTTVPTQTVVHLWSVRPLYGLGASCDRMLRMRVQGRDCVAGRAMLPPMLSMHSAISAWAGPRIERRGGASASDKHCTWQHPHDRRNCFRLRCSCFASYGS